MDLQSMSDLLVDRTEPICQSIDAFKASMLLFDTSDSEAGSGKIIRYMTRIIKQLKALIKRTAWMIPMTLYLTAYGSMPSHAA